MYIVLNKKTKSITAAEHFSIYCVYSSTLYKVYYVQCTYYIPLDGQRSPKAASSTQYHTVRKALTSTVYYSQHKNVLAEDDRVEVVVDEGGVVRRSAAAVTRKKRRPRPRDSSLLLVLHTM